MTKLIPTLPRNAWVLLAGDSVSAFGSGLVLPFLIVYFHQVRGLELEVAALTLSLLGAVGFIGSPLAGALIDRIGARRALIVSLWLQALAVVAIASVRETWHAFAATALLGIGEFAFWPAVQSILSTAVAPHQRSAVFSVHYAMLNAGIGTGGMLGGLLVDVESARSFEILYLCDAVSFVVFAAVLVRLKGTVGERVEDMGEERPKARYSIVLKDRLFRRVWLLMALLATIGYAQLESGFPAFATGPGGVGTKVLGFAFAANTAVIVVSQLFVLKKLTGWRRTSAVQVLCLVWAGSWLLVVAAGRMEGWSAAAGFIVSMGLFGLGETVLSPTIPAIVNDLAPDELRGRYNGVHSLSWSAGNVVGPALAGYFVGAGLGEGFFVGLAVACGLAALSARGLARRLPAAANLIAASDTAPDEPPNDAHP